MKRSTEYAIIIAFVIANTLAIFSAYHFFGDNEEALYFSLVIISMTIMGVTAVLAVLFLQSSRMEAYRELEEERRRRESEQQ